MQIEEILNYAFPITDEDFTDPKKMYDKNLKRDRLRRMVEQYKNGDIVNFDALHISVDKDELMKKIRNEN